MESASRMSSMIDDLPTYSRIDAQRDLFSPVNMDEILTTAIKDLKVPIEESGASMINDNPSSIMAGETQMVQLMESLLGNAIRFGGGGAPKVHIAAKENGREWTFSIIDNGIGIDPQHGERIFHMFQRLHTRDEYPGTGIGLAIVKKIVDRHSGSIWFESDVGKGTTFYFTIPIKTMDEQVHRDPGGR